MRVAPKEKWVDGEIARQFWERTIRDASVQSKKQFIAVMVRFLEGVVQQAMPLTEAVIVSVSIVMRRKTVEMTP
ncbi:uncharacterized protein BJ212DRAFT_1488450 [Suillus subaureus]|uniref:Uncharacterized protein n=1 Tax=Suillus subaureus TaxID=48587 RepID=A0A9P7DNF2_9AGAM|nr:uncharacterized protein BJ212DRAFT_1488450 [Suillus subaureus]KAG1799085.1 hypothetical protein BJ212DRAFT_1488450 [Suillus subaureus]